MARQRKVLIPMWWVVGVCVAATCMACLVLTLVMFCVNATMFDRYGDADNPNGELPSYITGAENWKMHKTNSITGAGNIIMRERIHN